MKCPHCGQEVADGSSFCPYCSAPLKSEAAPGQPAVTPPAYGMPATPPRTSGMAIASLVAGILGIILSCLFWPIGLVLDLAGLILGILGLNETKKEPGVQGKEMAIIGIVLGVIGLVVAILYIVGIAALLLMGPRISTIFEEIYKSLQ